MTRALVCLAHGRVAESLVFHPLGVVCFGVLLLLAVTRLCGRRLALPVGRVNFAATMGVVALLVVWGVRLAHGLPGPP